MRIGMIPFRRRAQSGSRRTPLRGGVRRPPAVLTLRAIHHSDRLPRFWHRFYARAPPWFVRQLNSCVVHTPSAPLLPGRRLPVVPDPRRGDPRPWRRAPRRSPCLSGVRVISLRSSSIMGFGRRPPRSVRSRAAPRESPLGPSNKDRRHPFRQYAQHPGGKESPTPSR